jgi:hypothetical protein
MPLRLRFPEDFSATRSGYLGHLAITRHHPHTVEPRSLSAGGEGIGEHGTRQEAPFVRLQKCR